jgi:hypothetical protein
VAVSERGGIVCDYWNYRVQVLVLTGQCIQNRVELVMGKGEMADIVFVCVVV